MPAIPKPDFHALGIEIARQRLTRGWSLDKLGDASQLSRKTIINIEQGHKTPTIASVHALAHALGIPLENLIAKVCIRHTE